MNKNQLGIDQISDIGKHLTINPKNLTCSICYCLNINARECMNKKCQKLFCEDCAKNNIKNNTNNSNSGKLKNICPFCRLQIEFTKVGDKFNEIIDNLKFFCADFQCDRKYNLD